MGQPMQQPMQQPMMQGKPSRMPWIVLAVVVIVVLAVLGFLFRDKLGMGASTAKAKLSGYDAVFLTNGQVYFGKISDARDQYVVLKDIYYLQVNQQLQSGQQGQNQQQQQQQQQSDQQPQLSLVKLGNELHGPDDTMHINRDQILFYEDLKADGRVAQAIAEYQKNQANPQPAAQGQQGTQPTGQPAQQAPAPQPAPAK